MQTGTFASDSVTKLLQRLAYQVNHTVHTPDADAVHDLRVAIRRFGQSITLFKPAFHAKEVKKIHRRLDELMDLTNDPRDCDVALNLIVKRPSADTTALKQEIQARRKERIKLLLPALRRWGARQTSSKWRAALTPNGAANEPLDATVRDRLPRVIKRLLKDGAGASSSDELHKLRIAGKKLRYSFELIQPVDGRFTNAIHSVTAMQSALGRVNDCRAVRKLVGNIGGHPDIERWLKKRQKKKAREFREQWATFDDTLNAALLLLRHPPRKPMGRTAPAPRAVALRA